MLSLNLDRQNDILYMAFSNMEQSYGDEKQNGIVIFYDFRDDTITGITIFDFIKRYKMKKLYELDLPIDINFEQDVCSKLGLM